MRGGPSAAPALSDGRYTLTRRLGEGGMATVFLAWDNKLKVWRAVKVLLPSVMLKKKVRKRFENEAHAMARLEHPNIVRVYDVGAENDVPYMVMELAEGGCIIDWLQRYGPMPPRLAVDVIVQVCKGIRAAHEAGIVHRDVKPHNVLVNGKGTCKVTDFGIAQVMDIDTLTKTGSVMGTWGYMAPEQRTDAKNVDERADVFAIGATLYTLLTGRTPTELYVADDDDEIFEGIPPELLEVITTACRYKPAARYPDVKTLGVAVYKAGTTQPQVPPSTPSLVLKHDPLPESVESAPLSPTIVQDLNKALGKGDTTAPDEDEVRAATPVPVSTPVPVKQTEPSKVLPYYMPSKRTNPPVQRQPGVPSYLDPTEAQREMRAQKIRAATPPPVQTYEAQPAADDDEPSTTTTDVLIKLAIGPLLLFMLLVGVLGFGTIQVNGAARTAVEKAGVMTSRLAQPGPIVDALVAAGADRAPLETAYLAFADARGNDKAAAAEAFVDALEAANASIDRPPPSITNELQGLTAARDDYEKARDAWAETADGLFGWLAVTAGLTRAP